MFRILNYFNNALSLQPRNAVIPGSFCFSACQHNLRFVLCLLLHHLFREAFGYNLVGPGNKEFSFDKALCLQKRVPCANGFLLSKELQRCAEIIFLLQELWHRRTFTAHHRDVFNIIVHEPFHSPIHQGLSQERRRGFMYGVERPES